jgi:hypothetical protein
MSFDVISISKVDSIPNFLIELKVYRSRDGMVRLSEILQKYASAAQAFAEMVGRQTRLILVLVTDRDGQLQANHSEVVSSYQRAVSSHPEISFHIFTGRAFELLTEEDILRIFVLSEPSLQYHFSN